MQETVGRERERERERERINVGFRGLHQCQQQQ